MSFKLRKLAEVLLSDELSVDELLDIIESLQEEPELDPDCAIILDALKFLLVESEEYIDQKGLHYVLEKLKEVAYDSDEDENDGFLNFDSEKGLVSEDEEYVAVGQTKRVNYNGKSRMIKKGYHIIKGRYVRNKNQDTPSERKFKRKNKVLTLKTKNMISKSRAKTVKKYGLNKGE
jgi:hypothetical protein